MANFAVLMLLLIGITFIFEAVELMRRSASVEGMGLHTVLAMAALKLPHTGEVILPFGILFSAIFTCWKLNRTQELVVIRAAGLSVWQFLNPLLVAAALIGIVATCVVNPAASILLTRYQQMENMHLRGGGSLFTVSASGIWLRQPTEGGYALIHAGGIDRTTPVADPETQWRMTDVIVYFFNEDDSFHRRIDSPEALLKEGFWQVRNALISDKGSTNKVDVSDIPTELTPRKIEESFSDPDTISFWRIPEYINIMKETGFPSIRLAIHFHSLLAQPLLFAAMILLAATFSLRPARFGGTGTLIALGVGAGFFIFFMESMLGAFGISQKIPAFLAAWTPAAVSMLLGLAALLHLEDG
jgi:lipopolysaccharide export system permease protein